MSNTNDLAPERLDTKGRRVGARSSADKGKFPKRIETGLCPGLEDGLTEVADALANLRVAVQAMAANGTVGSEGVMASLASIEQQARSALAEWADG